MRRRFIRREPKTKETAAAAFVSGVLAAGVGLVTFYVVRLLLARDETAGDGAQTLPPHGDSE